MNKCWLFGSNMMLLGNNEYEKRSLRHSNMWGGG